MMSYASMVADLFGPQRSFSSCCMGVGGDGDQEGMQKILTSRTVVATGNFLFSYTLLNIG